MGRSIHVVKGRWVWGLRCVLCWWISLYVIGGHDVCKPIVCCTASCRAVVRRRAWMFRRVGFACSTEGVE